MLAGGIAAALPAKKLKDRWDLLKYGMFMAGCCRAVWSPDYFLLNSDAGITGIDLGIKRRPLAERNGLPFLMDALIAYVNGPMSVGFWCSDRCL